MADTITINVDGKDIQVQPKIQLIEALRSAGIDTPAFCYHPDLKVAGNCRICMVEVEGPRGFAYGISCHLQTAPGMKVRTQNVSEKVTKARKGVMEFLLVNHPLDCPICDKAGECTLQEHYMGQGRHESRLDDEVAKTYKGGADHRFTDVKGQPRGGKAIDLGPSIVLDQERCIVCTRCVRFMEDVAKSPQLDIAGRGDRAYLTTFPGQPLNHDYDLNTTDICPVGALTGKHFRFQQRVWMLKSVESIAPDDSLGANLTIDYNQDKVWRLMPRRNPDVNKSWIHNATRLLYQDLALNRLSDGRVNGADKALEETITAAGKALAGASNIALVASGHATVEDNAALLAFRDALIKAGKKAEIFGGSWLAVGKADSIGRSGDPVANRRGLTVVGIPDNLDQLAARAAEFGAVLTIQHDLWAHAPEKAKALDTIPVRIALAPWLTATVAKATIAVGVRAWAEVRGTMINCNDRIQIMNPVPVVPNAALEATWRTIGQIAAAAGAPITITSEVAGLQSAATRSPRLAGVTYRAIGPMGLVLKPAEAPVAAAPAGKA